MSTFFEELNKRFENKNYIVLSKEELHSLVEEAKSNVYRSVYEIPGHFYSPIPDMAEVNANAERIWKKPELHVPGININPEKQYNHLREFFEMAESLPFPEEKNGKTRYHYNNPSFAYADAITLHC